MLNHLIDNSTDHGITINLIGDNVLGADVEWVSYGIWSDGDLAITGEGTLTVYANNACVFSSGELKIDGATVDVIGQNDYGIASFRSNIIIQNNAHVTGSNCAAILITDYDYGGYINIISSTVNIEATADGNGIRLR